ELEERELIEEHPRLLRSLQWGDEDYGAKVLEVVELLLDRDPGNARTLLDHPKIERWIKKHEPALHAETKGVAPVQPFRPVSPGRREEVERALEDAETLVKNHGAARAIDRVHTAFHAYLLGAC